MVDGDELGDDSWLLVINYGELFADSNYGSDGYLYWLETGFASPPERTKWKFKQL